VSATCTSLPNALQFLFSSIRSGEKIIEHVQKKVFKEINKMHRYKNFHNVTRGLNSFSLTVCLLSIRSKLKDSFL
jgi:hypothetical protein